MNNNNLNNLKCKSCNKNTTKLTNQEIDENLTKLIDWNINDDYNMIYKKFIFKNFRKSLELANLIGDIAENELHHPDISIGYGYCLVMIHTHAIKCLSINDFILASKIDLINL